MLGSKKLFEKLKLRYFLSNHVANLRINNVPIRKFIKSKISLKNSKNGDLFFWKGHIGIKINRQYLMHAYGPKKKVIISNINKLISELETKRLNLLAIKRYKLK